MLAGNRVRHALGGAAVAAVFVVFAALAVFAQGARKEVAANKAIATAEPSLFAQIQPGQSFTYRVTLKSGRTFRESGGDGLAVTPSGGLVVGDPRRVSDKVYEVDVSLAADAPAGVADIRVNFTNKKGRPRFVRAGVASGGNEVVSITTNDRRVILRAPVGNQPFGLDKDGNADGLVGRVFVCDSGDARVSVFDVGQNRRTTTVAVGSEPRYAAVSGIVGQQKCFVTNFGSDSVSVIDVESLNVITTIPVGDGPVGIALSGLPGQIQFAYVANLNSDTVSIIDTQTNQVVGTVSGVGDGPTGVAVAGTIGNQSAVVTSQNDSRLTFISVNTGQVTGQVGVGSRPLWVAVGGLQRQDIFTINNGAGTVSFVDLETRNVTATVRVGNGPTGAVVVGPLNEQEVYVTNRDDSTVSVVDVSDRAVRFTILTGGKPRAATVLGPPGRIQRVLITN